jgi:17-hydroxy-3-oxo-4-pregnene-20-carboxyl-CoA lyase
VNGDTIVAGIGQTEFSKDSGRSELQLAAEAGRAAILDAGLTPADIDGVVTFTIDTSGELDLMRALGVRELRYWSRTPYGGAGANTTVQHAAMAVASGVANAVLVYRAFNERSGRRFGQPPPQTGRRALDWYSTFGIRTPAQMYSLWFRRYMDEFGVTNEDFGRYTVVARRHAATNPNAWFYRRPITLDDHQQSRWICEPVLRLLDCCQESDGGVALVVTRADRARDLPQPAVRIEAAADAHLGNGGVMYNYYHPDLAVFPEAEFLGRQLWERSGLGPDDIDVAMLYENFSPIVFYQLEAFGFCKRGEAKDFIADGNIDLDGALPVNTNGGLLGEAYIHGLNNILEGVRQVRGTAANQVANVDHVLVAAGQSGLVLGSV